MTSDPERLARAGLSRSAEPGDRDVAQLVAAVGAVAAWEALRSGDPRVQGSRLAGVAARARDADPDADLTRLAGCDGRLICPGEPEWPAGCDDLEVPPLVLWTRGAGLLPAATEHAVAIVGTRAASEYGMYVAGELAAALADRGYAVVSGGAYGVDGAAHRGCLVAGGATVVVLACGVNVRYPDGHAGLFERIAATGVLVSELAPGTAPFRTRFLQRNRLIAALSMGTVVVEAGHRSGALSTAAHAERLARPVMAVPGLITAATAAGCHRLIRDGRAILVRGVDDVIEAVSPIGAHLVAERSVSYPTDGLPAEAARVLDALPVRRLAPPARIAAVAGVDPATVLGSLGLLAGLGLAEERAGGWRRVPEQRRGQLRLGGGLP